MKYFMKKEVNDLMLTGSGNTAPAHNFLCALESRGKDRKIDHFL